MSNDPDRKIFFIILAVMIAVGILSVYIEGGPSGGYIESCVILHGERVCGPDAYHN